MKIKKNFSPVVITLESEEEVEYLLQAVSYFDDPEKTRDMRNGASALAFLCGVKKELKDV